MGITELSEESLLGGNYKFIFFVSPLWTRSTGGDEEEATAK